MCTVEQKKIKRIREFWYRQQGACCFWCQQPVPPDEATADHIIERSKGGRTTIENIRMACAHCNWHRSNGPRYDAHVKARQRHLEGLRPNSLPKTMIKEGLREIERRNREQPIGASP